MKVKLSHAPYIARKIALDLLHCEFVQVQTDLEELRNIATEVIIADIKNEQRLDAKVNEMLEEVEDTESDEELSNVDFGQIFWQVKRKLAKEYEVILNNEERYNEISHKILDEYWQRESIEYSVAENRVRNIIYEAMMSYLAKFDEVEDAVHDRLKGYKRKLIPGTEDYDLVYQRIYEDELTKRGML
jgi:hypothetical protein